MPLPSTLPTEGEWPGCILPCGSLRPSSRKTFSRSRRRPLQQRSEETPCHRSVPRALTGPPLPSALNQHKPTRSIAPCPSSARSQRQRAKCFCSHPCTDLSPFPGPPFPPGPRCPERRRKPFGGSLSAALLCRKRRARAWRTSGARPPAAPPLALSSLPMAASVVSLRLGRAGPRRGGPGGVAVRGLPRIAASWREALVLRSRVAELPFRGGESRRGARTSPRSSDRWKQAGREAPRCRDVCMILPDGSLRPRPLPGQGWCPHAFGGLLPASVPSPLTGSFASPCRGLGPGRGWCGEPPCFAETPSRGCADGLGSWHCYQSLQGCFLVCALFIIIVLG